MYERLNPEFLNELNEIQKAGDLKHKGDNWKDIKNPKRYFGAKIFRHLFKYFILGQVYDKNEPQFTHLTKAAQDIQLLFIRINNEL